MTEKEIKKLSRLELLDILVEQGKENDELKRKLEAANKELDERKIRVQDAGTLAEASLRLNSIFDGADKAAEDYLENIKKQSQEQERLIKELAEEKAKLSKAIEILKKYLSNYSEYEQIIDKFNKIEELI